MDIPKPRGQTPLPLIPDESLPAPIEEPREIVFEPRPKHFRAVDAFMESGGDVGKVQEALGVKTKVAAYSFTKRTWFLEQIRRRGFVPVDPAEVGRDLAVRAGIEALEQFEDPERVRSVDELVKLGGLGTKMMGAASNSVGVQVNIGTMQQLDLRGMGPDRLRELLGGSAAEAQDAIEAEWKDAE